MMKRSACLLSALALCATASGMYHPHLSRTETLELEKLGKLEVSHITIPFNAKLMENLPVGLIHHLGFAELTVPCELKAGDVKIPAGKYALTAKYQGDGKWTGDLYPVAIKNELAMLGYAMLGGKEAVRQQAEKRLEDAAKKANASLKPIEFPLAMSEVDQPTEHLAIHLQVADAKAQKVEGLSLGVEFGNLKAVAHLTFGDGVKPASKD
ncbi:MAG: hypothetical protein U1E76_08885 [Planctomycetota bacterium]